MLSFTPSNKIEKELKRLQGLFVETYKELEALPPDEARLFVETYKELEALPPDEARYLHRFALISRGLLFWTSCQKTENEALRRWLVADRC